MQAENRKKKLPLFERLDRLRRTQQLTWSQVAEELGVSVAMLMMVKAGTRNLSGKVLARLEWAEVEAGLNARSRVSEEARAIGKRQRLRIPLVTENDIQKGYFDFRPEYQAGMREPSFPEMIRLKKPDQEGQARLGMVVAKSFESEIVVFACLPDDCRSEAFLENLTPSSRNKLHDSAMALVFGTEWRTTVARLAVESRAGDRTVVEQILGRKLPS